MNTSSKTLDSRVSGALEALGAENDSDYIELALCALDQAAGEGKPLRLSQLRRLVRCVDLEIDIEDHWRTWLEATPPIRRSPWQPLANDPTEKE